MSGKYKFWDSNRMYFISFATVNRIDVFIRNEDKDEIIKSWQHCQQKKRLFYPVTNFTKMEDIEFNKIE